MSKRIEELKKSVARIDECLDRHQRQRYGDWREFAQNALNMDLPEGEDACEVLKNSRNYLLQQIDELEEVSYTTFYCFTRTNHRPTG
jgi:uncharacterized protein YpiB (UPF0302 family)